MVASQKMTASGAERVTRRGFVFGALALAVSATIGRPVGAGGLDDGPLGSSQPDPPDGSRYRLRLAGREVCSFQELHLGNLSRFLGQDEDRAAKTAIERQKAELRAAAMSTFASQIVSSGVGVGSPSMHGAANTTTQAPQQQEDDEPAAVLRDGTAALPVLARWYEASEQAREAAERPTKLTLEPEEQDGTPELRDPVIVKLSRDDKGTEKVLGRIQLEDATIVTLAYAADGKRVKELVLTFKDIGQPEQPSPEAR